MRIHEQIPHAVITVAESTHVVMSLSAWLLFLALLTSMGCWAKSDKTCCLFYSTKQILFYKGCQAVWPAAQMFTTLWNFLLLRQLVPFSSSSSSFWGQFPLIYSDGVCGRKSKAIYTASKNISKQIEREKEKSLNGNKRKISKFDLGFLVVVAKARGAARSNVMNISNATIIWYHSFSLSSL